MTQKLMVYNVRHKPKANPILRFGEWETGNGTHLCQSVCNEEPGTGTWPCDSGRDLGYSLALGVCLHKCSNPLPSLLIPISLIQSILVLTFPLSLILTSLNPSSSSLSLMYTFLVLPLALFVVSLPRNKHAAELPPFAPSLPYITLMKALRVAYMNLSLTILRHINHTPSNPFSYEGR